MKWEKSLYICSKNFVMCMWIITYVGMIPLYSIKFSFVLSFSFLLMFKTVPRYSRAFVVDYLKFYKLETFMWWLLFWTYLFKILWNWKWGCSIGFRMSIMKWIYLLGILNDDDDDDNSGFMVYKFNLCPECEIGKSSYPTAWNSNVFTANFWNLNF